MISRRTARKAHVCSYSCGKWIKSGSVYLRHAIKSKRTVAGTSVSCTGIDTLKECGQCATNNGRAGLLEK